MKKIVYVVIALLLAGTFVFQAEANSVSTKESKATTKTSMSPAAKAFKANLSPGDTGSDVRDLQVFLANQRLYKERPTSRFDAPTVAAVQAFQRIHGLKADSLVWKKTRRAINVAKNQPANVEIKEIRKAIAVRSTVFVVGKNKPTILTRMLPRQKVITAIPAPTNSFVVLMRTTKFNPKEKAMCKEDNYTRQGKTWSHVRAMPKDLSDPNSIGVTAVKKKYQGYLCSFLDDNGNIQRFLGCDGGPNVENRKASIKMARRLGLGKNSPEYNADVLDTCTFREVYTKYPWSQVVLTPNPDPRKFLSLSKREQLAYLDPAAWGLPKSRDLKSFAINTKSSSR